MSELEQKSGDAAHPTSGHADEMNPVMLAGEELWQIDFRGERHDWPGYTFPSFPPREQRRSLARDAKSFPTCEAIWPGRRRIRGYCAQASPLRDPTPSE